MNDRRVKFEGDVIASVPRKWLVFWNNINKVCFHTSAELTHVADKPEWLRVPSKDEVRELMWTSLIDDPAKAFETPPPTPPPATKATLTAAPVTQTQMQMLMQTQTQTQTQSAAASVGTTAETCNNSNDNGSKDDDLVDKHGMIVDRNNNDSAHFARCRAHLVEKGGLVGTN